MSRGRWIVLISLLVLLLLVGAFLLHPLVRFTVSLYLERFDRASSVYLSAIRGSERLDEKAREQLRRYVDQRQEEYLDRTLPYEEVMAVLSPLSGTALPQDDIERCIRTVDEMETARRDLAEADAWAASGDPARAIPLYRQSLIADDGAAYRLKKAEAACKSSLLDQVESAMDAGQYVEAESMLLEGLTMLEQDEDLTRAAEDARRLQVQKAYASQVTEAQRLLREEGPDASFRYVAALREQAPDDSAFEYLEQLVRHEYEEDICTRARTIQAGGDPTGACELLNEGLLWIDSERIRKLQNEIRASMDYWLVDMPIWRDETADPRTGAESTVVRNEATHSFSADLGSVTFSLEGAFAAFTGTVAFPQVETADAYRASATLRVYGDGQLLAEFKDVDSTSAPLPFSVPVEGVQRLTLSWTSEGANGWKDWGRFATVYDGRLIPLGGQ